MNLEKVNFVNDKQFDRIMNKLDQISKLLALDVVRNIEHKKEKIIALSKYDFKPLEICTLLGVKRAYVDNTLSVHRKERKKT